MSDIKIVIGAEVAAAEAGLKKVQGDLVKTGVAANQSSLSFKNLGSSISSLGSSLISGGVLTGIALLGAGLVELGKDMFDITEEQKRLSDVLDGAKNSYVKATLEVSNLKEAFSQARQGIITKEEALKLYNSTIGKTIGQTKDLDEAEWNLAANADNYIRFTLLKAAANIALGKAAEAAFKAEEERIKGPTKEGSFLASLGAGRFGSRTDEQRNQDRINKAIKEENQYKEIANSLQSQANQFGFDYNAISEKEIKIRKERVKVIKEEVAASRVPAIGNIKEFEPKLRGPLQTIFEQDVVIKPKVTIEISEDQKNKVAEGLAKLFDEARIQELSDTIDENLTKAFKQGTADAFELLGESLSEIVTTGKFDLPNLFGGLMRNLGQQLQELGRFLITTSTIIKAAKEAFKNLIANPVAQLVVGGALIALGALIKAQASKQFKGFATGVRNFEGGFAMVGERGPERVFLPRGSSVQPNNELSAFSGGGITLMPSIQYSGDSFRIMLDKVDKRWGRNN